MLGYLGEVEADWIRFYGREDWTQLDSPQFFRLAENLLYYDGVIARKARQQIPARSAYTPQHQPVPTADVQQLAAMSQNVPVVGEFVTIGYKGE